MSAALTSADLAARINEAHLLAMHHAGSAVLHACKAGELLVQSKNTLPHGQWLPWLREHITFSERTAQAYMRLTKRSTLEMRNGAADLSVRKALAYLATPRQNTFFEELDAVLARVDERKAKLSQRVSDWSIEEVRSCVANICEIDDVFHRHGMCSSDDCTACDREAAA